MNKLIKKIKRIRKLKNKYVSQLIYVYIYNNLNIDHLFVFLK